LTPESFIEHVKFHRFAKIKEEGGNFTSLKKTKSEGEINAAQDSDYYLLK
jgi:hypothetical protein